MGSLTNPDRMAKRSKKISGKSFSPDWLWGLGLFAAVLLAYVPVCWAGYIWGRRRGVPDQSGHRGAAGPEGNLDNERRGYLSLYAHDVLA